MTQSERRIDHPLIPLPPGLPPDRAGATLDDVVPLLARIADSLEAFTGQRVCDGEKNGKPCALDPQHVGHHTSSDGRLHWLDEE